MRFELAKLALSIAILAVAGQARAQAPETRIAAAHDEVPSLERRLREAALVVTQTDYTCRGTCSFPALVMTTNFSQQRGIMCLSDVALGNFKINGMTRKGVVLKMRAYDPNSPERVIVNALILSDEGEGREFADVICFNQYSYSDILLLNEKEAQSPLPSGASLSVGALIGGLFGTNGKSPTLYLLRPWQTTGWLKVQISSDPVGADIVRSHAPTGYRTTKILQIDPKMLNDLSLRIGESELSLKKCVQMTLSGSDVDLEIRCKFPQKSDAANSPEPRR